MCVGVTMEPGSETWSLRMGSEEDKIGATSMLMECLQTEVGGKRLL